MKEKKELLKWQKELIKEYGILAFIISGGQVRKYGPTYYVYEVVDVYNQYDKEEMLQLCAEHVRKAQLPIGNLSLTNRVLEFRKLGTWTYHYKCGHDYTG